MSSSNKHDLSTKVTRSSPVKAMFVRCLMFVFKLVPWNCTTYLARLFAWTARRFKTRAYKTTQTNLELCLTNLTDNERQRILEKSLISTYQTLFETLVLWQRNPKKMYHLMRFRNPELLDEAKEHENGVLIHFLHIGNFESLFSLSTPTFVASSMYRPIKIQQLDQYVKNKRERGGWIFSPATKDGVKQVFSKFKKGNVVVIYPDNEPVLGSGEFVPFFDVPALTMRLPYRMIQACKPRVLFADCKRVRDGFEVTFFKADSAIYSEDMNKSMTAMNKQLEQIIMNNPEQYLWSYKRFKVRPEGEPAIYND